MDANIIIKKTNKKHVYRYVMADWTIKKNST